MAIINKIYLSEMRSVKRDNEFLYNPLLGLSPVIIVSMIEPFFGLNIALHIGMLASIIVLTRNYFHKEYSNQPIVLYYLFLFTLYQYITSHVFIVPDGDIRELVFFHGLMVLSIASTFLIRNYMFRFFDHYFTGSAKHLENNLREFYFISKFLLVINLLHIFVYGISIQFVSLENMNFHRHFDYVEYVILMLFVFYMFIRIRKISKQLSLEDFLPIVNKDGVVIGKVARSVSFIKSGIKEMHPVVRVHFVHNKSVLLFKSELPGSDGTWDCPINEHLLYGENMDKTISRISFDRFSLRDFKPCFLLKHIVEKELEKQYVLLYYSTKVENVRLKNTLEGTLKFWPAWQIEENLGKGVFSNTFEIEYEYLRNTVFIAEEFAAAIK
jgi:hypothetical protein